jgi:hypothetical protein
MAAGRLTRALEGMGWGPLGHLGDLGGGLILGRIGGVAEARQ